MDSHRIISNIISSFFRIVVRNLHGILIISIVTKLLGADSYGIWITSMSFVGLFVVFGKLHLDGAQIRFISDEQSPNQTLINVLSLGAILSVIFGVGFYFLFVVFDLSTSLGLTLPQGVPFVLALIVTTQIIWEVVRNYPKAKNNVILFEKVAIFRVSIEVIVILVVLYVTQNLLYGFMSYFIISFLTTLGLVGFFARPAKPDMMQSKKYLSYSLPMVPMEISDYLLRNADKIIIMYLLSPTATGIYAVSYGVGKLLKQISNVLRPTLYPAVTRAWDNDEMKNLSTMFEAIFKWYFAISFPALVGITLISRPLLEIVSTPNIAQAGWYLLPILGFGFILEGLETSLGYILTARKETGVWGKTSLFGTALNIAFNFLLIPLFGLMGAAIATSTSYGFRFIVILYYTRDDLSISFPIVDCIKICLGTMIMGGILIASPTLTQLNTVILYPILGVVVYSFILFFLDFVTQNEWQIIYSFIRNVRYGKNPD